MNKVADAVNKFSEKFARFSQSGNEVRIESVSDDKKLQKLINERERSREDAVISTYRIFQSPYVCLGSDSARAGQIDSDEQSLLEAYRFFKSVTALNAGSEHGTAIRNFTIETPLSKRESYIRGGLGIYLKIWFILEKRIEDFVPVFEEKEDGSFMLEFESTDNPFTSSSEIEIFNIIRRNFYN